MKAIVVRAYGGPEVLEHATVDDPRAGRGEVVVALRAIGVNPVETYIRSGTHARKPALPWIPGSDGAGVVEAVGEGVTTLRVGDRVYTIGSRTGTYAERCACAVPEVVRLPLSVSFAQGAALHIPYTTAWVALFAKARIQPAEVVLVHGASGGVGTAAVQLARAAGAVVIGTAGTPAGLALALEHGAHHVLDHQDPGHLARAVELTGGRGIDVVVEMLANVNLDLDLNVLAQHGRVVVVGNRGRIEIDPRRLMTREASILGMSLHNLAPADQGRIQLAIVAGLEAGTLRPVVGRELPLAAAAEAHRAVLARGAHGKIVLVP